MFALHTAAIVIVNLFRARRWLEAENVLHCDERQHVFNCGAPIANSLYAWLGSGPIW